MKPTTVNPPEPPIEVKAGEPSSDEVSLRDLYVQALLQANESAAHAESKAEHALREAVARLVEQGVALDEIAQTLGVSLATVRRSLATD